MVFGMDRAAAPLALYFFDRCFTQSSFVVKDRKRYVLCCYKHTPGTSSLSVEIPTLLETLRSYSITHEETLDSYYWRPSLTELFASARFAARMLKQAPTHIILSSYTATYSYMPSPAVLRYLKDRDICVVHIWWDTCSRHMAKAFLAIDSYVDIHVVLDNPCLYFMEEALALGFDATHQHTKLVSLFYPFEYRRTVGGSRDISIIFLGQTGSYRSVRKEYLEHVADSDLSIVTTQSFASPLNEKDYDNLLLRSKIGINFSESVDSHQLKARVFELMRAGCLVVEQRNDQTAMYFEEGVDYISFSSKEELLEKLRFFLVNESERVRITAVAYEKASRLYNGNVFWNAVFNACDTLPK